MSEPVHMHAVAVALAVDPDGPLGGVLLLGPSGSGKTRLALRLVEECPWRRSRLVADDVVHLSPTDGGGLIAVPPASLKGLAELRGAGPAIVRALAAIRLRVVLDFTRPAERVPDEAVFAAAGGQAALFPFAEPHDAAAPVRVRLLLRRTIMRDSGWTIPPTRAP